MAGQCRLGVPRRRRRRPADAPADLGQGARPARTGRPHRLDRRGAVRYRPALVRPARSGGVAAGRRARQRLRGGDAAVCGADPRDRRRPVRPRRRHRRIRDPRRLPRGHRGDAGGRGTAAPRRVPDRRGQRRLLALAVVLRRRRRDVAGPRRAPGTRAGATLVDHRRQPAHAGRRHRRREPGDAGASATSPGSWASSPSSRRSSCRRSSRTCRPGTSSTASVGATAASAAAVGSGSTRRST